LALISKFELLLKSKRYSHANEIISKLLKAYPDEHIVLEYKGKVMLGLKKIREAQTYLEKAHKLSSTCPSCARSLASCYTSNKRYDDAVRVLKQTLGNGKKDLGTLRQIFLIYHRQKKTKMALKYLDRILKIEKDDVGYAYKADIMAILGNYAKAQSYYKEALDISYKKKLHDDNCGVINDISKKFISMTVRRKGNAKGIKEIETILKKFPRNKDLRKMLNKMKKT
ncbi:MAG: CDC27 family protein, partial [Nanoarchaeota archaeon]